MASKGFFISCESLRRRWTLNTVEFKQGLVVRTKKRAQLLHVPMLCRSRMQEIAPRLGKVFGTGSVCYKDRIGIGKLAL